MKGIAETLGVSRSNLYERRQKDASFSRRNYRKVDDEALVPLIREIVDERPTYGYPRTSAILNRRLQWMGRARVNRKRVYRVMKRNGLLLERFVGRAAGITKGRLSLRLAISDGVRISLKFPVGIGSGFGWPL